MTCSLSSTRQEACARAGHVKLNERQAQAILDMRLGRLTGLERDKLTDEGRELRDTIVKLLAILGSDSLLMEVIEGELLAIKKNTQILAALSSLCMARKSQQKISSLMRTVS